MTDGELLHRVVYDGSLTGEFDLEESKRRFRALFKLETGQVDRYFSGRAVVLKRNLTEAKAMEFAIRVIEAGCECSVELMPDPNDLSLRPGFVERRRGIRRTRFRRPPRPGAFVADRRDIPTRRKIDLLQLDRYGAFPGQSVEANG